MITDGENSVHEIRGNKNAVEKNKKYWRRYQDFHQRTISFEVF